MILLNQIVQGVLLGGYYAVVACGLSFMFSVMQIINLAHGGLAVLAAYALYFWPTATKFIRYSDFSLSSRRWR